MNVEYHVRVNTSLIATKFLLMWYVPFRGSDESINSYFKGSFLELVDTLKEINPEITSVIDCAPGNNLISAPKIQKDLVTTYAYEITQQIVCDIVDDMFFVLIDECGDVAGFINDLSLALQKHDQDLLNALSLVNATKQELQEMRNDGWEELISNVIEICNKHDIDVSDMDVSYVQGKKPRRYAITSSVFNLNHYKHDYLFSILDLQLHKLNARFDEENTEILQCVSCLSPSSSFAAFDVKKLLRIVELYPNDFFRYAGSGGVTSTSELC
ncbi:hypothetical protein KIW84_073309 [Lathyrus oleraceus]|uniref:DUF4371 domain-containing protein n=1 Tax=Pisum sativum TaxID=3888 RepID=A0A9D4ZX59_PEA|nr:hypothetical protein KIW84_073308 [Pisum sativum]KAI5387099.1 hypothetical protein KIW84_073309 [Pisum sativum]